VLKRYAAWPERRVDAIREVAAVYAVAQQLMADANTVTQVRARHSHSHSRCSPCLLSVRVIWPMQSSPYL